MPDGFREALLGLMERKVHWAWPAFTSGRVSAERLHVHLEHEWEVYVRDFPVLLGRAYVQCPIPAVRRDLAENLYEEETGGIAAGRPHPELFLEIPAGLGLDLARFPFTPRDRVDLLHGARVYRELIDDCTSRRGWPSAVAVTTLFLEGTPHERSLFDPAAPARPEPPLAQHPLVVHYGLPVERLSLVRAHRGVEGEHRLAAWRMVLHHVPAVDRPGVLHALEEVLAAWLAYRDDVAAACGLARER
ncbi:MAG: iron-containing redox enzyme family protein [Myxococcota bacterium]